MEGQQAVGLALSEATFAAELAVDLESMSLQESGLYIQVLEEGRGPGGRTGRRSGSGLHGVAVGRIEVGLQLSITSPRRRLPWSSAARN